MSSNHESADFWKDRAATWLRDTALLDHAFRHISKALMDVLELDTATSVLDVGCGAGTLTERVMRERPQGLRAVGVDIAEPMIVAARDRLSGAEFIVDDAQTADLAALGPFDRIMSRFGVMFFSDPVAAFANLRAAALPGAELRFVCWRDDSGDMFEHGLRRLIEQIEVPLDGPRINEPGPLGLATRERIDEVLKAAGWSSVSIRPLDVECEFGVDGSDGVEERLEMVTSGAVGQAVRREIEGRHGQQKWRESLDIVRAELRESMVDGVVTFTGRTWLVSASNRE